MSRIRISYVLLSFALFCRAWAAPAAADPAAQEPLVLSMDTAIAMALQQNRDLLIAGEERVKADAQVGEAKSGAYPQLTVAGQYMRYLKKQVMFLPPGNAINPTDRTLLFEIGSNNAYSGALQLSQALYSRKVGVALQIAKTYRELAKESYTAAQQGVIRDTRKAFYQVLLAKKLVEVNRQGLEVIQANYQNVKAQYRVGAAAEYDLLRAEVQLANTEPMLISAENTYQLAVNALKNLLALPLDQPVVIEGEMTFTELPAEVAQQAEAQALAVNPTIKQLALQEQMLDKNIAIEKAGAYPTLYGIGSYIWQSQDNTFKFNHYLWANTINAGVSLSCPLFDGFRTRNRVQQAKVERNKVHYTRLKVEEGLKVQIQAGALRMMEARKRMSGQEKNIEQAQKAVRIAQTRFKSGVGTQLELLDAQVAMTRSQTNYAQALYDYLVSKTEWEYATGTSR
ncbi:MAG TPA: TolC family protein [bacterium]|nr:TolC family protein [bacterium]